MHAPDGSGNKIIALPLCHAGDDPQKAEADIRAFRGFGPPVLDAVEVMPYPVVNTLLDGGFPKGALNYWKSAFLTDLSDDVIAIVLDAYEQVPSPMSAIIIEHLHGQATRVAPTATAYPWRETGYSVLVIAQWADPADTQTNVAWAQDLMQQLRPHLSERRYMNYMSADDAGLRAGSLRSELRPPGRAEAQVRPDQRVPPQSEHRPEDVGVRECLTDD